MILYAFIFAPFAADISDISFRYATLIFFLVPHVWRASAAKHATPTRGAIAAARDAVDIHPRFPRAHTIPRPFCKPVLMC